MDGCTTRGWVAGYKACAVGGNCTRTPKDTNFAGLEAVNKITLKRAFHSGAAKTTFAQRANFRKKLQKKKNLETNPTPPHPRSQPTTRETRKKNKTLSNLTEETAGQPLFSYPSNSDTPTPQPRKFSSNSLSLVAHPISA